MGREFESDRRMILLRHYPGCGPVAALVTASSCRFVYLTGDPPDSLRETCQRQQEELQALVVGHVPEGFGWRVFSDTMRVDPSEPRQPERRAPGRRLQNLLHLVLKRTQHHTGTPSSDRPADDTSADLKAAS